MTQISFGHCRLATTAFCKHGLHKLTNLSASADLRGNFDDFPRVASSIASNKTHGTTAKNSDIADTTKASRLCFVPASSIGMEQHNVRRAATQKSRGDPKQTEQQDTRGTQSRAIPPLHSPGNRAPTRTKGIWTHNSGGFWFPHLHTPKATRIRHRLSAFSALVRRGQMHAPIQQLNTTMFSR